MKILLAALVLAGLVAAFYFLPARNRGLPAPAGVELPWLTDAAQATAQAKAEGKPVLMDFTGSDWCVWCQRLDAEVFATAEFAAYAKEHLVLLKLDFPRSKTQPEAEKQQNQALLAKYGVEGFPTIIVLDASGKKIGELGYLPGGPSAWLAELRKLTKG
jgi:thiol:disulfide interchange protein